MNSALSFLRRACRQFFHFAARVIAGMLPVRLWYPAVLRISLLAGLILRPLIVLTPYRSDIRKNVIAGWMMNTLLHHLSTLNKPFPIAFRTKGVDAIFEASANPNGMVAASIHLPLIHLMLRSLVDAGRQPTAVVTHVSVLRNGKTPLWGTDEGLTPLALERNVLIKVRGIMRHGGSVAALIDPSLGSPLNLNIFRLIRLAGARVVFAIPELMPDGTILVEFLTPPDPFCLTHESVLSNLHFLQTEVERALKLSPQPAAPVVAINQLGPDPTAAAKLSEVDSSS